MAGPEHPLPEGGWSSPPGTRAKAPSTEDCPRSAGPALPKQDDAMGGLFTCGMLSTHRVDRGHTETHPRVCLLRGALAKTLPYWLQGPLPGPPGTPDFCRPGDGMAIVSLPGTGDGMAIVS